MNEKTKDFLALKFPEQREAIRAGVLTNMTFEGLAMWQLDFSNVKMKDVGFGNCVLSQSNFSRCLFDNVVFEECVSEASIMADARFVRTDIIKSNFDNSLMIRAGFDSCCVQDSSFRRVDFSGSDFRKQEGMSGCSFNDCCLDDVMGLEQERLMERFLARSLLTFYRAINAKTNKSLLGTREEKIGDYVAIPASEVSLDDRAGCDTGLHICKTSHLAEQFGKEHFEKHKVVSVEIKPSWLKVVHLSGDFGRVSCYKRL